MAGQIDIKLENDPTPLVKLVAHQLALAMAKDGGEDAFKILDGSVTFTSAQTSQSVTVEFFETVIKIRHGENTSARVRLCYPNLTHADQLECPSEISESGRYPLYKSSLLRALTIGEQDWKSAATTFWQHARTQPFCPSGLSLQSTEPVESLELGDQSDPFVMRGNSVVLAGVLTGRCHFMTAVFTGKIVPIGSFQELNVMSGLLDRVRMGDKR